METRVELTEVRKNFGSNIVLDGVSLRVQEGRSAMIIGPNACGKTTLLKIIAGILKPDSGQVRVNGTISIVFQEDLMAPWMTIRENIGLLQNLKGMERDHIRRAVEEVSQALGIHEYIHLRPKEASGGTLRKASIARALTLQPDILLLDEPLVELDSESRQTVLRLLEDLRRRYGLTMIMTTHYPEELTPLVDEVHWLTQRPTRIRESRTVRTVIP